MSEVDIVNNNENLNNVTEEKIKLKQNCNKNVI